MQTPSLSGWLSIASLFFLMMILSVFFWNCYLSQICILYIKQVSALYLFHGIICILQHEENQCKYNGPQRSVRLLTGILANVLTCFVCSVIMQLLKQRFKNTNIWLWIIQLRNQHRRDEGEDTEGKKEWSAYDCRRTWRNLEPVFYISSRMSETFVGAI